MNKDELIAHIERFEANLIGLEEIILFYFKERGYVMPNVWEALAFADTEKAEALEVLLAGNGKKWVRNNPEDKPDWDRDAFADELGDMLMMITIAGLTEGLFPVTAMLEKMKRKLR